MVVPVERKRKEAWIRGHSHLSFAPPLPSRRLLSRVVLRIERLEHASDMWEIRRSLEEENLVKN